MKTSNNSARDLETTLFGQDGIGVQVDFSTKQVALIAAGVFVAMYAALMLAKFTKVGG